MLGNRGRTVTLKVKFADFTLITRSQSVARVVADCAELERVAVDFLVRQLPFTKGVRLLGVALSSLAMEAEVKTSQMKLGLSG